MKESFDNLVNRVLAEAFGSNPYRPEEKVECPFRLQDSLVAKGINTTEEEASQLYNQFKGKQFNEVEKSINLKRSTPATTTPTAVAPKAPVQTSL